MVWFLGVVIVLVVGAAVVVALGRGGAMRPVYDDRPDALVPADRPLGGEALRTVRFSVGLRGYRMDEVDALLARLADQLDEQHDEQHDAEERR
ncbi:MAG TPA: DivIVA domain-containing protein [Nocardioidaceae bacterium]|nr:DivIVA domain-containing protein [Nocardioidaceae bacterium]